MESKPTPIHETTPNWSAGFRRRVPFYILASVLLALLAAALAFFYLEGLRTRLLPSEPALVAAQAIPPGAEITEGMVEVRSVPQTILPAEHLREASQALGRRAAIAIPANQVLLPAMLEGARGSGLSARLPDGRWAMVLPAGWLVSPVPALLRGDRLDLVAYQAGQPVEQAGTIVSSIEVLDFSASGDKPQELTVAVSLEEAIAVLYARSNGFNLLVLLRPEGG